MNSSRLNNPTMLLKLYRHLIGCLVMVRRDLSTGMKRGDLVTIVEIQEMNPKGKSFLIFSFLTKDRVIQRGYSYSNWASFDYHNDFELVE